MKPPRLCAKFGALTVACVALLHPSKATADGFPRFFHGASYLATFTNSTGAFVSRVVIALHADHTMSVESSNSSGPTFFFTGELGAWEFDRKGGVEATTIDFGTPQSPGTVIRVDYTISFQNDGSQIAGTETVTGFPLQANPLDGGGTILATDTFTGVLITP